MSFDFGEIDPGEARQTRQQHTAKNREGRLFDFLRVFVLVFAAAVGAWAAAAVFDHDDPRRLAARLAGALVGAFFGAMALMVFFLYGLLRLGVRSGVGCVAAVLPVAGAVVGAAEGAVWGLGPRKVMALPPGAGTVAALGAVAAAVVTGILLTAVVAAVRPAGADPSARRP